MEPVTSPKKSINFFFLIIVLILGPAIYKQFDFETLRFKNIALALIYIITFLSAIILMIKDYRKPAKK